MSDGISESSPLLSVRVDGGPWRISADFIPSRIVCRVRRRGSGKGCRFSRDRFLFRRSGRSVASGSLADAILRYLSDCRFKEPRAVASLACAIERISSDFSDSKNFPILFAACRKRVDGRPSDFRG